MWLLEWKCFFWGGLYAVGSITKVKYNSPSKASDVYILEHIKLGLKEE
ncbi:hypothetical protein [Prevotella sp. oral taxon 299]|nr:hypothetical protein [Prevotella sp. oral taxon 299]